VVKAAELSARPDALGREGQSAIERAFEVRAETEHLTVFARDRIIELAAAMARRIVGESVSTDPVLVDRVYEKALAEIGELVPVTIRVHPDDRAVSRVDELAAARGAEVVEDAAVGRAGCRVEAGGVVIDATVEAALAALRSEMTGTRRG
jgi:flagellar assembly protein FliH